MYLAKFYPKKVQELMDELFSKRNIHQYTKYEIYKSIPSKQGALAQIESYDCKTKNAYHRSWNEIEEYSVEKGMTGIDEVEKTWNDIFVYYVDIVDDCSLSHKLSNNGNQQIILLVLIVSMIMVIVKYSMVYCNKRKLDDKLKENKNDITPLLSISQNI